MHRVLVSHPDHGSPSVARLDVNAARRDGDHLRLAFALHGAVADLAVPKTVSPSRADELWKHTCFEAFLRTPARDAYFEFNFSPSSQWAAYRFDRYREGMRAAEGVVQPEIVTHESDKNLALEIDLNLGGLAELRGRDWRVGLSAVIEERNGRKSWWALAHPAGKPDFHHADCFALELPQVSAA